MPDHTDDPSIPDQARLWRAVLPVYLKPPNTILPGQDFSTAAFKTQEMSVYLIDETSRAALEAKFPDGTRFREFTAKAARDAGFIVVRVPNDDGDLSHALVLRGDNPGARPTPRAVIKLTKASKWADE